MPGNKRHLFVSYAREDRDRVLPLVDAVRRELEFRAVPVDVWMDMSHLRPSEQWDAAIVEALESSIGFLFFISVWSLSSPWVHHELETASATPGRLIIPVFLYDSEPHDLPWELAIWQGISFVPPQTEETTAKAAEKIATATEEFLKRTPEPRPVVTRSEAPHLASEIAEEVRASTEPASGQAQQNTVFVVHGHDDQALRDLEAYLVSVDIVPIVLSRRTGASQSLFQKFMAVASQARFAVVLLGADDYGASRKQYDAAGVADRALQFRARQNVILELGFFYGKLGWENVFVVYKDPDRIFPNFERPSDLDGVVFDSVSDAAWREKLGARLSTAGFRLKAV
jgi:predicted nucleotide-binding protein